MPTLFSQDSALMRGLSKVAVVMLLNLIFIATSIPIVTLGASLTALNFTAMRIATDNCDNVIDDYFRSFRRNFRQATVIGGLLLLLAVVFAAWYAVIPTITTDAMIELGLYALWYVLLFYFAVTVLWVFPYLANFEGKTRDVLRNARLMSWKHPFTSLAAIMVIVLAVGVTIFYPQATGYGLIWLAIGFAGIAAINGRMFASVFSKYSAASASHET